MGAGAVLEKDAIIGDRYRLVRRLGEGGMGWVWEATHVFTHARFALKFLKGAKEEDRRRFVREVRAAAAVKHPNVIGVHDFVELPSGTLVMVMDLLEGETLGDVLRREGRVSLPEICAILLPVVSALEAAHAVGIVHRDLKPDNIFLAEKKDAPIDVKVLDFGIAKLTAIDGLAARTQALTGTGSMLGTPYYMSPEQVVAEKDLDARADIWSLGVLLYECLAGVRPTEADNVGRVLKRILLVDFTPIAEHVKELPEDVAALVGRMLVGDRDARLRALSEVRAVLERHAATTVGASTRLPASEDVDAHADTLAVPSEPPDVRAKGETHSALSVAGAPPRSRSAWVTGTAVVALGLLGVVGFRFASKSEPPATPVSSMPSPVSSSSSLSSSSSSAPSASVEPAPLAPEPSAVPAASASASALAFASAKVAVPARPAVSAPPMPIRRSPAASASIVASAAAPPLAPVASAPPSAAPSAKVPSEFAKTRKD